jgi:hypothetical protein
MPRVITAGSCVSDRMGAEPGVFVGGEKGKKKKRGKRRKT